MSESHIGIQAGEKNPMFGKYPSEETRRKIGDAFKGKPKSEEHTRKVVATRRKNNSYPWGNVKKLNEIRAWRI